MSLLWSPKPTTLHFWKGSRDSIESSTLSFKVWLLVATIAAGASVGGGRYLASTMELLSSWGFECGIDVGGVDGSEDVVMAVSEREGFGLMTRRPKKKTLVEMCF
ncbi:uncharacterized protein G2W53_001346 [Senna tora]|uniref:Uncharacterized protein n=1 Tax=Senna tora TaxID=362788 RepID=A0A835CK88_9FABA|nr:uncharacterized protein G2W53_001346 [Senna tora]